MSKAKCISARIEKPGITKWQASSEGKAARISGGVSGIGKSVAIHFAKEGADVAILYLEEPKTRFARKSSSKEKGTNAPWLVVRANLLSREIVPPATLSLRRRRLRRAVH